MRATPPIRGPNTVGRSPLRQCWIRSNLAVKRFPYVPLREGEHRRYLQFAVSEHSVACTGTHGGHRRPMMVLVRGPCGGAMPAATLIAYAAGPVAGGLADGPAHHTARSVQGTALGPPGRHASAANLSALSVPRNLTCGFRPSSLHKYVIERVSLPCLILAPLISRNLHLQTTCRGSADPVFIFLGSTVVTRGVLVGMQETESLRLVSYRDGQAMLFYTMSHFYLHPNSRQVVYKLGLTLS